MHRMNGRDLLKVKVSLLPRKLYARDMITHYDSPFRNLLSDHPVRLLSTEPFFWSTYVYTNKQTHTMGIIHRFEIFSLRKFYS